MTGGTDRHRSTVAIRLLALGLLVLAGAGSTATEPRFGSVLAVVHRWAPVGQEYEGYVCSAVRLAPAIAATAAHCIADRPAIDVVVGGRDLCGSLPRNYRIPVESARIHPEFHPVTLSHDIALLRLSDSLDAPVVVARPVGTTGGLHGVVAGYGPAAFGSTRPCRPLHQEVVVTDVGCSAAGLKGEFCATGMSAEGLDACPGASGAPLLVGLGARSTGAVGLVSSGVGCGDRSSPGVYVSLSAVQGWIRDVVHEWGE